MFCASSNIFRVLAEIVVMLKQSYRCIIFHCWHTMFIHTSLHSNSSIETIAILNSEVFSR